MTVYNKTKVLLLLFLMGSCLLHDSIQQNKSVVVVSRLLHDSKHDQSTLTFRGAVCTFISCRRDSCLLLVASHHRRASL